MLAAWHCKPHSLVPESGAEHTSSSPAAMSALGRCCRGMRQLSLHGLRSQQVWGRPDVSVCALQGLATRAVASKEDTATDANLANKARARLRRRCLSVAPCKLLRRNNFADTRVRSQAKALDTVLKEVNSRFGKGSIMKLGSTPMKVYGPALQPSGSDCAAPALSTLVPCVQRNHPEWRADAGLRAGRRLPQGPHH